MAPFRKLTLQGAGKCTRVCLAVYLPIWLALAIAPVDRSDWLLENLLVFVAVPYLLGPRARSTLGCGSYVAIYCFLLLHAIGAHYTYSLVPVGDWFNWAAMDRNHYDRAVHFAFGLLITLPMQQHIRPLLQMPVVGQSAVTLAVMLCCSAIYELMEWGAAVLFGGELGIAFVGAQGDPWDAHKDMALAGAGALIALLSQLSGHLAATQNSRTPS
ncbi:MAG: DUF2238 domain-containing protein [Steroidobacteraceae bacterium]